MTKHRVLRDKFELPHLKPFTQDSMTDQRKLARSMFDMVCQADASGHYQIWTCPTCDALLIPGEVEWRYTKAEEEIKLCPFCKSVFYL